VSGPLRRFTILRRAAGPAPTPPPGCERCRQDETLRRELEGQARLAQERRLEILELQRELEELRRRAAGPAVGSTAGAGLCDAPSIGDIPLGGRPGPRRAGAGEARPEEART
jgi:hypothetical protein